MKSFIIRLCVLLLLCTAINSSHANIYTVTLTADNATSATTSGTLRWALTQANSHAGKDSVYFNISILNVANSFEFSGVNSFAVIALYDSLPAIRDSLLIDGSTQPVGNLASISGKTVGVDAITQANFKCPDIYIVPSSAAFPFPDGNTSSNNQGTGLTIINNQTIIKKLAISGFGNTNTDPGKAQANACITVYANPTEAYGSIVIQDCFLGCDPMGVLPTLGYRKTKGQGILVQPNRHGGTITHNYISYTGVNGINLNCTINASVATSPAFPVIRGWSITDNYIAHPNNAALTPSINVVDATSCLGTPRVTYARNYIEDTYQTGLDIGHNADTSLIENNTVTNTTRTVLVLPQVGIRITASCRAITVQKNLIYNNSTSSPFIGGIYTDGLQTSLGAAVNQYNSGNNIILNNSVHDNQGAGIIVATYNGNQSVTTDYTVGNVISQNNTYNNTGLGIDLGYNSKSAAGGATATTGVTLNDAGDPDTGPNLLQNYPIIDSAIRNGIYLTVWGKAPTGATLEFFTCDGGINKIKPGGGTYTLNYGEGKDYLGTGVEGSAADLATGTASYADVDGNAGNTATTSKFQFNFTLSPALAASIVSTDSLTSTATIAGIGTSEYGPQAIKFVILSCDLKSISGIYLNKQSVLSWNATCDNRFNYFDVEYSTDGTHFSSVGKVYADVNNNNPKTYGFNHNNPDGYNNYYRLKMVDKDGAYTYSNTILIRLKTAESISIGPNPASDYIYVNVTTLKDDMVQVRLVNQVGNVILTRQQHLSNGANSFTIKDINHLPAGVYILQVITGDDIKSAQMLIKH